MSFKIDTIPVGAPTTGTLEVYSPDVLVVINGSTVTAPIFRLSDFITFGTDVQIGGILVGPVLHMSPKNARGRVIETIQNTSTTVASSGATWSEKKGPARRKMQLAWTDPMDQSTLLNGDTDPEVLYADALNTYKVGADGATRSILEGLIYELDGIRVPLAVIPALEVLAGGTTIQTYTGRNAFLYGRLQGNITSTAVNSIQQIENKTDVVRVESIEILEEV
jgi:hypothetical protein